MHGVPATVVAAKARESILALQEMMLSLPDAQKTAYPIRHYFSDGWYMREITVPAHQVVIGKIHKHAHQNCISVGLVRVFTETGYDEMAAPFMFVSEPGTKRVVLTLEETVWTTYHHNPTNTRDLAELEAGIIAASYEELDNDMGLCRGSGDHRGVTGDRRDRSSGCGEHLCDQSVNAAAATEREHMAGQCSGEQDDCRYEPSEPDSDRVSGGHLECAASASQEGGSAVGD